MTLSEEIEKNPAYSADFVKRSRHGSVKKVGIAYFILLGLIFLCILLRENFPSETFLLATVLALVSAIVLHAIYSLQRNLDLITEIEFQNTLFSSSIAKHADFCIIVRNDGNFAYADRGFTKMFPGFVVRDRGLEQLMEVAGVARSDADRLYDAIKCRRRDWFMFTVTDTGGETRQMILNLYPLPRPDGYFLIQGREVVERRGKERKDTPVKTIAGPTFRYMLYLFNEMPMGTYVLSPSGHVRVANRVLERWLSYNEGEIMDKELTCDDLLYRADGTDQPDFSLKEYIGPVTFARKNGSLFKARLEQHVVKDEEGGTLAVIGMVREKPEDQ